MDGTTRAARATNRRDIDPSRKVDVSRQKLAYYPASMMPPPDLPGAFAVDRKRALAALAAHESPAAARSRREAGGEKPAHYAPTAPAGSPAGEGEAGARSPYAAD